LLKNLDKFISMNTGLPVFVAEQPLTCVVRGTGKLLINFDLLRRINVD
jgi:rod shape-determining protein MreB and related proteins